LGWGEVGLRGRAGAVGGVINTDSGWKAAETQRQECRCHGAGGRVSCLPRVCGISFAPLGQLDHWIWFNGFRDAQSSIASPVATFRRPVGAKMV
jgi:hypothetical protein